MTDTYYYFYKIKEISKIPQHPNLRNYKKFYFSDQFFHLLLFIVTILLIILDFVIKPDLRFKEYLPHLITGFIFLWITVLVVERLLKVRELISKERQEILLDFKSFLLSINMYILNLNVYSCTSIEFEQVLLEDKWGNENLINRSFNEREIEIIGKLTSISFDIKEVFFEIVRISNLEQNRQDKFEFKKKELEQRISEYSDALKLLVGWMTIDKYK